MEIFTPTKQLKTCLEVAVRHLGRDDAFVAFWYAHRSRRLFASDRARIAVIDLAFLDIDLACDRWCMYTDGALWLFDEDLFGLPPSYERLTSKQTERRSNGKTYDASSTTSLSQMLHDHPSMFIDIKFLLDLAGLQWQVWMPHEKGKSVLFISDAMSVFAMQLKEVL